MSYLLIKCQKSHRFQSKQIFQVISVKLTFTLFSISFPNQEISIETEIQLRQFKKKTQRSLEIFSISNTKSTCSYVNHLHAKKYKLSIGVHTFWVFYHFYVVRRVFYKFSIAC